MKNIISLDDFKTNKITIEDSNTITKAGKSFRERFSNALIELELTFDKELYEAKLNSEVKTKINISNVLKQAKSSPLAAYSELHKEFVENKIKEVVQRCNKKLELKFQNKTKPTIESLHKQLIEERNIYKNELAKLASQKMTEYLELKDKK